MRERVPRERLDATAQAVKLLAGRERTERGLERALVQRGYEAMEIAGALERVKALGYLDDAGVAKRKAKAGFDEGRSLADVERRLVADGIDEALAAQAARAEAKARGYDELAQAEALVAKRRLAGAKAARFLASRGFSEDVVERVIGAGAGDE